MTMRTSAGIICCLAVLFAAPTFAQDTAPAPDANTTQRATDDLKAFYADPKTVPPYAQAVTQLLDDNDSVRTAAGKYLAALLVQDIADETAGRAPVKSLQYWGGGQENTATELRKRIARKFAEAGGGDAGLDAAQWLIEKDPVLENQVAGFRFVASTNTPRADAIVRALLASPHHNPEVLISA